MLETLVSPRIRRTLFEYLLTHPAGRFYLRGLAKALGLSVSPLRRELKRLERSGMLQAEQEGNILFYTVNQTSPTFLQLQHAGLPACQRQAQAGLQTEAPSTSAGVMMGLRAQGSGLRVVAPSPEPTAPSQHAIPIGVISATPRGSLWQSPLSNPMLLGAAGAGIALMLIMVGLFYVTMMNQRLVSQASLALTTRKAEVTGVAPQPAASGTMSGRRWRVVPGGFGGFSSGSSQESY